MTAVRDRPGKDAAYMLDSTKLRSTFDWRESVSLDAGLEECVAWVKENLEELKQQPLDYIHRP